MITSTDHRNTMIKNLAVGFIEEKNHFPHFEKRTFPHLNNTIILDLISAIHKVKRLSCLPSRETYASQSRSYKH